jgi:hypothetical protein
MSRPIRLAGVVLVVLTVSALAFAGDNRLNFVPWKVLDHGVEPAKMAFLLFWIPASSDEMRHSGLITSERLTLYAGRCIGMHVVRADDRPMLVKLGAQDEIPLAILIEGGREVARVANQSGLLSAAAVEAMVRKAFDTREVALNMMLDQASAKAASGEKAEAISLYRRVAAQGCAFPRLARTAQRAMRRFGVKE